MRISEIYAICKKLFGDNMNVKETLAQLRYGKLRRIKVMSWWTHRLKNLVKTGLLFEVNAHRHKGFVLITLDWSDTYNIYLISRSGLIKKEMTGVYFDELTEQIDEAIEKVAAYQY